MKQYSLTGKPPHGKGWGEIKFQTSDSEMYDFLLKYMDTIIDAFKWQNHIERTENPPVRLKG